MLLNIMGGSTCSAKHTDVQWDHRFSNADFWTEEQKTQFGIGKTKHVRATSINEGENVHVCPIEELQRHVGEAVQHHDGKAQVSIDSVRNSWDWLTGMDPPRQHTSAARPVTGVVLTATRDTLPLARMHVNWKSVVPTDSACAITNGLASFNGAQASTAKVPSVQLMPDQRRIVEEVTLTMHQTLVFVLAGGGNGKTVMINAMAAHYGDAQMNFSYTGSAAALLPRGETLSSVFGTNLSQDKKNYIAKFCRVCRHIVIDEISMAGLNMLLCVNSNLKAARRSTKPFGGLKVTLVGDMVQLKAVQAYNIYDEFAYPPGFMELLHMFTYYTDGDFSGNKRSDGCPALAEIVTAMRVLPPFVPGQLHSTSLGAGVRNWSETERALFKPMTSRVAKLILTPLSEDEAKAGFAKVPCTIFNRTNKARSFYNMASIRSLGVELGRPVYIFRRPLKPHSMASTCAPMLYEPQRFPMLFSMFVKGAPAVLSANENVACGITNGTACVMHSIYWENPQHAQEALAKAAAARPGEMVEVEPPTIMFVELNRHKCDIFWKQRLESFPSDRNLHPPSTQGPNKGKKESIVLGVGMVPPGKEPQWAKVKFGSSTNLVFKFGLHSVVPALSLTAWKTQGQSYVRALMDISKSFGAKADLFNWELLYVMITRVRNHASIRVMPATKAAMEVLFTEIMDMIPDFFATRFRCFAESMAMARRAKEALQLEGAANRLLSPVKWTTVGRICSDGWTATWTYDSRELLTMGTVNDALAQFDSVGVEVVDLPQTSRLLNKSITLQPGMVLPPKPMDVAPDFEGEDASWAAAPAMCLLHVGSVGDVDVACNNAALTWLANIKKHLKDGSTGPVVFKLSRCDGKTKKSRKKKTGAQQMTSRITPLGIVESPTPDAFARKTCGLLAGIGGINYTRRVKFMELAMPKGKWKNMSTLVKRMIQSTSESMLEDTAIVCLIVRREEPHTLAKQTDAVDLSSLYKNKPKPVLLAAVSTATCGSAFVALCKHNDRWWLKTNKEVRCLHEDDVKEGSADNELKKGVMFWYGIF